MVFNAINDIIDIVCGSKNDAEVVAEKADAGKEKEKSAETIRNTPKHDNASQHESQSEHVMSSHPNATLFLERDYCTNTLLQRLNDIRNHYRAKELEQLDELYIREADAWQQAQGARKRQASVVEVSIPQHRGLFGGGDLFKFKHNVLSVFKGILHIGGQQTLPLDGNAVEPISENTVNDQAEPNSGAADKDVFAKAAQDTRVELSGLLSLELSLRFIHVNKEALHRVVFIDSFASKESSGPTTESDVEHVFQLLVDVILKRHIQPAFEM